MAKMKFDREETKISPLVSVFDAAKMLDLNAVSIRKMIKTGELPGFKILGNYKIKQSDIEDFIERHST